MGNQSDDFVVTLVRSRDEAAARLRELEALLEGLRVLGKARTSDQIYSVLLGVMKDVFGFERVAILTPADDASHDFVTMSASDDLLLGLRWTPERFLQRVVAEGPAAVFDTSAIPEWRAHGAKITAECVSALHIPLHGHGVLAVIVGTSKRRGAYTANHLTVARRFAVLAVQALQNADLYSRQEAEHRALAYRLQMEAFSADVSVRFINLPSGELDEAIEQVLGEVGRIIGVDRSYVCLFDEDGGTARMTYEWNAAAVPALKNRLQEIGMANFGWAKEQLRAGGIIYLPSLGALPPDAVAERQFLLSFGVQSLLAIPMIFRKSLFGLLGFDSIRAERKWTDDDQRILQTIGNTFAHALERRKSEKALRISEERYRTLYEESPVRYLSLDGQGVILDSNPAWLNLLGYDREEIVGRHLLEYLGGKSRSEFPALLTKFVDDGLVHGAELEILHKSGVPLTVTFDGFFSFDDTATPAYAHCVMYDITDRKQMEVQLRAAQKMESVGLLAAGIAHEINTPIQFVGDNQRFLLKSFEDVDQLLTAYAEVLPTLSPERQKELRRIEEAVDLSYLREEIPSAVVQSLDGVERVAKIVHAMKEFSHPGMEEKSLVDINRAIETTVTIARNEWKYVAEVDLRLDADMPMVCCQAGDINQVLLNLIVNASQAIAEENAKRKRERGGIVISTKFTPPWAEIRISDTGTGIPENLRTKIFTPFFTTKEVGKGTGQGLAVAYSIIVKRHDGTIDYESVVGEGTTFIVRLPVDSNLTDRDPKALLRPFK